LKRKMRRWDDRRIREAVEMAAAAAASAVQVVGEAAVAAAAVAAAATVVSAVAAAEREVRQIGVWARVLKGELGAMEEQMSRGIAVAGDAVGGLGVEAEESRGWASVSSEEEVEVMREYEAYGAGGEEGGQDSDEEEEEVSDSGSEYRTCSDRTCSDSGSSAYHSCEQEIMPVYMHDVEERRANMRRWAAMEEEGRRREQEREEEREEKRMREMKEAEEQERVRQERAELMRREVEERDRRVREEMVRERREQARLEEEAAVQQRVRREKAIRKKVRAIEALQRRPGQLTLEEQEKVDGWEGLQLELGQLEQDVLVGGAQAVVSEGVRDEVMMMKVSDLNRELIASQERVRELEGGLASGEIGRKMVQDEADMKWRKRWRGMVMAGTEVCNECGRKAVVMSKGVQTEIVRGVGGECVERGVQCD
jgi:flagellar biosynthesis GTPase FlhF